MNASLNRRQFSAGLGAIVVAFSLDPDAPVRAGAAAAAGQPADQPPARCVAAHQCRRHRHRVHRQGRARAGHPHGAAPDRGRGARPAARAHRCDLRRHRPHAQRGTDGRQPVGREQRHGFAHGGCGSARHSHRARRQAARRCGRHAHCRRRRDQRARTAARSATASSPPKSDFKREASAKVDAEAGGEPPFRRQVDPAH